MAGTELELLLEEQARVSGAVVGLRVLARPGSNVVFDSTGLFGRELAQASRGASL